MAKSQAYLKQVLREIKLGQEQSLPMAQGMAIKEVIKRYKIPAKRWGYSGSAIAVQTNKQKILWRDRGTHLDFLGIVNEELKGTVEEFK
jgi:CRISPR/Cas system-associated exonuclease Cas4 (RecB family)